MAVPTTHVKSSIDGKVRELTPADCSLTVTLPDIGNPLLVVIRDGGTEALSISRRVAEELIAAGFSYGN
jgi:hypothetical protein